MIGKSAFCPKTGAQLSEECHYDEEGRVLRAPVEDAYVSEAEMDGELTAGAVRSSRQALLTHFRRTHQFYRPANDALYRKIALWLRQLKQAANGPQSPDMIVWLSLSARVRREEHDAAWMLGHVELRCPRCHGRLKYEEIRTGVLYAECGTNCTDDNADRLTEIEDLATDLYAETFDCEPEEVALLESRPTRLYPSD
jgi:hypothetical protein